MLSHTDYVVQPHGVNCMSMSNHTSLCTHVGGKGKGPRGCRHYVPRTEERTRGRQKEREGGTERKGRGGVGRGKKDWLVYVWRWR